MKTVNLFDVEKFSVEFLSTKKIAIVHTLWNKDSVNILLKDCTLTLQKYGVKNIYTYQTPGSIEVPFQIKNIYQTHHEKQNPLNAIIAISCVVKGDTPHFKYVSESITYSISKLNLQLSAPIIFGVLTVNNMQQLHDRVYGTKNIQAKGVEFALTTIQMLHDINR